MVLFLKEEASFPEETKIQRKKQKHFWKEIYLWSFAIRRDQRFLRSRPCLLALQNVFRIVNEKHYLPFRKPLEAKSYASLYVRHSGVQFHLLRKSEQFGESLSFAGKVSFLTEVVLHQLILTNRLAAISCNALFWGLPGGFIIQLKETNKKKG